mmetsp:Transcript_85721/g.276653  ORF Transcript_85721/g.276653 Transcript_85721/m.276653 type:complete len:355 (+) Transcript_85721:61-1125(+)
MAMTVACREEVLNHGRGLPRYGFIPQARAGPTVATSAPVSWAPPMVMPQPAVSRATPPRPPSSRVPPSPPVTPRAVRHSPAAPSPVRSVVGSPAPVHALALRCNTACSTPRTAVGVSVAAWTPKTPQQAMLAWRVHDEAEKQQVADCIDALYRHRKATLRFLRRCEDTQDLLALQQVLDPQPRRSGVAGDCAGAYWPSVGSSCPSSPAGPSAATAAAEAADRCRPPPIPASFGGAASAGGLRLPGGGTSFVPLSSAAAAAVAGAARGDDLGVAAAAADRAPGAGRGATLAASRSASGSDEVSRAARLAVAGLADAPRLRPELGAAGLGGVLVVRPPLVPRAPVLPPPTVTFRRR